MEYTQNYQLPLWDKEDAVIRTDFNENNQKIDAAIAAATSVSGSYASTPDTQVDIDLGFRPKLVFVMGYGQYGYGLGVMMDGMGMKILYENTSYRTYISNMTGGITDNGFYIDANASYFNETADRVCYYTAVR